MRYVCVTASVAAVGLLLSCSGSRETGNNSQMKAAIESAWNATNLGFVTGEVRFIDVGMAGRRPDASKGEDALSELPLYRAFAAKGLLKITAERDLTSRFSGWNDWFELTQSGVRRTARITLTEKGRQTGEVRKVGDVEELFLRLGEAKIEDIVANDALVLGADRYRVVLGTHTFDIPEDVAAAYVQARNDRLGRERRFKALLKYDPFEKEWKFLGADLGPRTGVFETDHVDTALAMLRLCGRLSC